MSKVTDELPAEMNATEYRQHQLETGSEAQFQQWLVSEARHHGWMVFWLPDWMFRLAMASIKRGRRGGREWPDKGFPDVWCLHPTRGELVVFELKREDPSATTTTEQDTWLAALQAAGVSCYVVRPHNMTDIERIIAGEKG